MSDEFFIGYNPPPMPTGIARVVTRAVIVLGAGGVLMAAGLAIGHVTLGGGVFEFGHPRAIAGVIVERPYPALRMPNGAPDVLLVAAGKHGADALVRGLDGRRVTLTGTRIQRGDRTMLEIEPASISVQATAVDAVPVALSETSGPVTLRGEIVDGKCFLGVMVPGDGTTHKACASLCLRGGLPPALLVRDRAGRSEVLLLVSPSDEPLSQAAAAWAGEPVEMTGVTTRRGDWWLLRTDPATWRPLARATP